MAKTGYQAVALDPDVAKQLRGVAHYWSITSGERVTLSETAARLVQFWADTIELDPAVRAAVTRTSQSGVQRAVGNAQS